MDFYHVLPSNTSPNYFPNNNASEYSTPIDNPYDLSGKWEVGLIDLTYSTCVNTFNNDNIIVDEEKSIAEAIRKEKCAVKVMLPVPQNQEDGVIARKELVGHINETFKTLLQLRISDNQLFIYWKLLTSDFYFIISPALEKLFELWSDVLSTMDGGNGANYAGLYNDYIPSRQSDVYIIVAPVTPTRNVVTLETVTMKKKGEKITPKKLEERFKTMITPGVANVSLDSDGRFHIQKLHDDNKMIVLNDPLRQALRVRRACMFHPGEQKYVTADFENFDPEWVFSIIYLKTISVYQKKKISRTVTLPPHSFVNTTEATKFVMEKLGDKRITLICNATDHLTLTITDSNLTVTFDNNLRDIFGFDINTYSGRINVTASRTFSLTRCIQFLYIYSNVGDTVRIGNTESPLLAIVPFSNNNGCSMLKEKVFKIPMYIGVSQVRISQIDIAIYDGAGQLVPFVADAVTTLRLHFRQI